MDNISPRSPRSPPPPSSPSQNPSPPSPSSPPIILPRVRFPRPRWHSHDPLFRKIKSFLHYGYFFDSEDLVIPLVCCTDAFSAFQDELRNCNILTEAEAVSLRYDFDPNSTTLTIHCICNPVHDAIVHLVIFMKEEMVSRGFLAGSEIKHVRPIFGTSVVLPRPHQSSGDTGGNPTSLVLPDAAFAFVDLADPDGKPVLFPRVIFEVAVSQSYESVLEDARQWLLRGWGFIKAVVVIKLHENAHEWKQADPKETSPGLGGQGPVEESERDNPCMGRANHDVNVDGSSDHVGDAATLPPHSHSSDTPSAGELLAEADATSVSEISGFIEIYRCNEATKLVFRDGDRVDIFAADVGPAIKIKDLLPGGHITGDDKRSYTIPLGIYRQYIKVGSQLARVRRALEHQRIEKGVNHRK